MHVSSALVSSSSLSSPVVTPSFLNLALRLLTYLKIHAVALTCLHQEDDLSASGISSFPELVMSMVTAVNSIFISHVSSALSFVALSDGHSSSFLCRNPGP